jgi:hypothetical protein
VLRLVALALVMRADVLLLSLLSLGEASVLLHVLLVLMVLPQQVM